VTTKLPYAIVTPVFNEADCIQETIESVLEQTVLPQSWVIVDDGSTDATATIIRKYAAKYSFIKYHYRIKPEGQAYFSSNVYAIMEGYQQLEANRIELLAILDGDIVLPRDYYEEIIRRMEQSDNIGIASGIYENLIRGKLYSVLSDRRSTPKAIMAFRRNVFDTIGGFVPLKYGGEDTCACVMARMKGWKTWSFPDLKVVHLRPTGLRNAKSILRAKFVQGMSEYGLGSHALFVLLKSIKRSIQEKPYGTGGLVRMAGYLWAYVKREERQVNAEVIRYYRREQLYRIFRVNRI